MKNVRIIPPKPKENKKLRVAAHCWVSTSGPEQLRSLEIQIKTYAKMIKVHPNWLFASVSIISKAGFEEVVEKVWIKCSGKRRKAKLITSSPSQSAGCQETLC